MQAVQKYPRIRTFRDSSFCVSDLTERITFETRLYNSEEDKDFYYQKPVRCLDMTLKKIFSTDKVLGNEKTKICIRLSYKDSADVIYGDKPSIDYIRYFDKDDQTAEVIYYQIKDYLLEWDPKFIEDFLCFELDDKETKDE